MVENQPPVPGLQPSGEGGASYIRQGLVARGLPEHVADAFVVNFQDESGLNPGINEKNPIVPGSRGGFGLYQLTGPRRVAYEQYAAERGVPVDDVDAQLDFMMGELQGSEAKAAGSILSAPDTATAAQAIVRDFLRPSPEYRDSRMAKYAALPSQGGSMGAVNTMGQGGQMPMPEAYGYVDPMVSAPNSRVAPTPSVEVAQALTPQPQNNAGYFPPAPQAGGLDPAVIQALSDPNVSPQNKQIAMTLVEQYQGRQQAAQEQAQKLALQQQELERRRSIAQAQGFDPALAEEEIAYKAAVEAASRGRQTQTVNGKVIDVNTGEVVFEAAQPDPTSVQEYNFYAQQMQANGQQPMDYNSWSLQKAGAGAQTNIGSIPAGMMLERDGTTMRLTPIPGSPAALEAEAAQAVAASKEGGKQTTADTIVQAATRAIAAAEAPGLPATGTIGNLMSNLSESNAAEVRRQVGALKSVGTLDNMIRAKEQGAAFGGTTESELALLADRAGALDPSSPNFVRDAKDYTRALFKGMYGPEEGERRFNEINWSALSNGGASSPAQSSDGWTDVGGVKIRPKGGN
jgi:hypothetical protein